MEKTFHPSEILQISGSYWQSCTLHAGVHLGVFSVIGDRPLTADEVSDRIKADPRATAMLLNALASMGFLVLDGDRYRNTASSRKRLVKDSPGYLGYMIMHHHHLVDAWARLSTSVVSGGPAERTSHGEDQERESFLMGMFNNAMSIAPGVASQIDLSGRRSLLDLGGGPGTYAIHFCSKNPNLEGTVYDLPSTRPFAEETIERFDLAHRIKFVGGDFTTDSIPGTYDVVWMSHILHGMGMDECRQVVRKAVSSLKANGLVFIHEFILDDTLDAPMFPAIFSLNMLLNTERGQSYSEAQLREMLEEAGAKEIVRVDFVGPNESGIVRGAK
ncbi:MAG: methyltransferase [Deltaproteobacteria bacterium]|nr:methyltransferase [Deltaproteobacteria bacterium]